MLCNKNNFQIRKITNPDKCQSFSATDIFLGFLLYYPIIHHNVLRGHSAHVSTRELPCYSVNDFVTNEIVTTFCRIVKYPVPNGINFFSRRHIDIHWPIHYHVKHFHNTVT